MSGLGRLIVEVYISDTDTRTRYDFSERQISLLQRPLSTRHTTAEHSCPQRDSKPQYQQSSRRRPYGHCDRQSYIYLFIFRYVYWISRCPHADQILSKLPATYKRFIMPDYAMVLNFLDSKESSRSSTTPRRLGVLPSFLRIGYQRFFSWV
jgi:hypothetical protein